jgi:hypothetical protein
MYIGVFLIYGVWTKQWQESAEMVEIKIITATTGEIADSPELRALLTPRSPAEGIQGSARATDTETKDGLPAEIADFIASRGRTPHTDLVTRFIQKQISRHGAEVSWGKSKRRADGRTPYLMLHAPGPRHYGAYAYVRPANAGLKFRLSAEAAEGYAHAHARNVGSSQAYAVNCPLRSEAALADALELAELALEGVAR